MLQIMKKLFLVSLSLVGFSLFSQEHYAGLTTSSRVGVLTAGMNPAELVNMSNKFETSVFGISFNIGNNKIGYSDLTSDKNIEDLIFTGTEPVNMRIDAEINGPGIAVKYKTWAFGFATKANAKLDVIDVDAKLGDAISNSGLSSILSTTTLNNNYNQRINGTTWGEVNLIAAKTLYDKGNHKINGGITFKLLFPGSYANLGADKFSGTIVQSAGQGFLTNTNANLNFSYSGSLADSFSNFDDYTKSIFGGLNGFAGDIGINYQWKDTKALDNAINNKKKQ
jgi:hypothetical protein